MGCPSPFRAADDIEEHPVKFSQRIGVAASQVTEPNGTLLGTSVGIDDPTPVSVLGGAFQACYRLADIVSKASDASAGYDDTGNNGLPITGSKVRIQDNFDYIRYAPVSIQVDPVDNVITDLRFAQKEQQTSCGDGLL